MKKLTDYNSAAEFRAYLTDVTMCKGTGMATRAVVRWTFGEVFMSILRDHIAKVTGIDLFIRVRSPGTLAKHFELVPNIHDGTMPDWIDDYMRCPFSLANIIGSIERACCGVSVPFTVYDYETPLDRELAYDTPSICRSLIHGAIAASYRAFSSNDMKSIADALRRAYSPETDYDRLLAIGLSRVHPMRDWHVNMDGNGHYSFEYGEPTTITAFTASMRNFIEMWETHYSMSNFDGTAVLEDNPAMTVNGRMNVKLDVVDAVVGDDDSRLLSVLGDSEIEDIDGFKELVTGAIDTSPFANLIYAAIGR